MAIEAIADLTGMGTAANLRHHFRAQVRTTPIQYRRAFGLQPG
jgi:AraC family transcriptional activator FtrA